MRRPTGLEDAEQNFPDGPTYRCGRRPETGPAMSLQKADWPGSMPGTSCRKQLGQHVPDDGSGDPLARPANAHMICSCQDRHRRTSIFSSASFASCLTFCKDPEAYRAFFGYAEELISVHIQQSGRLGIIRRFENLDSVDPKRARIKVIQVIPPSALRSIFYVAHSFTPTLQSTSEAAVIAPGSGSSKLVVNTVGVIMIS